MPARSKARKSRARTRRPSEPRFVGRDPSPVLERYPPREGGTTPRPPLPLTAGPPRPSAERAAPPPAGPTVGANLPQPSGSPGGTAPEGLIRLDRPFDVDEFSSLLGETAIRVTVPPDSLAEVLRRVTEFMGFGIYVYAISVRPAPAELLKGFVVELQRVDYDPAVRSWKPFVERGAAPSSGAPPP